MKEKALPFHCQRCGHCCQGQGGIVLTVRDVERLCFHLGLDKAKFLAAATEEKSGKIRLRSGADDYCIYFSHEIHGCSVHEARPDICRAWPFFRGNLIDRLSWEMVQEYCPGVNPAVEHGLFVQFGKAYLDRCGLVAQDEDAPAALRLD